MSAESEGIIFLLQGLGIDTSLHEKSSRFNR